MNNHWHTRLSYQSSCRTELEAVELWLEAAAGVAPRCQNLDTFMERIHAQELRRDALTAQGLIE